MNTLLQRRLNPESLADVIDEAPHDVAVLDHDHRATLAQRFKSVPATEHRRLDAWMVEQAGRPSRPFAWSPATARRILGNNALRRVGQGSESILDAVRDEVTDQLVRAARGYARPGSLGHWLTGVSHPVLGLITAEAANWATQLLECAPARDLDWRVATSDVYFDVAGARTTLRGRRDILVATDEGRIVVRVRSGQPGKSAGPGLRTDLVVETLADPNGRAPRRYLGVWPDAGLVLGVDGTMENVRAGARHLVRTAVAQRRHALAHAA